jgi:hypothetical protein
MLLRDKRVFKSAFTEIFKNAREGETDTCPALRRVMTKVLGSLSKKNKETKPKNKEN